jgi:hypothetical protein
MLEPQSPGWGWGALLLPYLEQDPLAQKINYKLPVEGPSNLAARTTLLRIYTCPSDRETGVFMVLTDINKELATAATNSYAASYGVGYFLMIEQVAGNGVFFRNSRISVTDILKGSSNTLAVGERAALFTQTPWAGVMTGGTARTTPDAPVYTSMIHPAPVMVLARIGIKPLNDPHSEPHDFFSPHHGVNQFLFADGSVRPVSLDTDLQVLQALASRYGYDVDS